MPFLRLLLGSLRSASVEAPENTRIQVIDQESLVKKFRENPQFAIKMLTVMARRLIEAHTIITNLEGEKRSLEIMFKA